VLGLYVAPSVGLVDINCPGTITCDKSGCPGTTLPYGIMFDPNTPRVPGVLGRQRVEFNKNKVTCTYYEHSRPDKFMYLISYLRIETPIPPDWLRNRQDGTYICGYPTDPNRCHFYAV